MMRSYANIKHATDGVGLSVSDDVGLPEFLLGRFVGNSASQGL
jgi:hypothetical protein